MQTAYQFSGQSLSNACIAMAGARDNAQLENALVQMFFGDEEPPIQNAPQSTYNDPLTPSAAEVLALATTAWNDAHHMLREAEAHGHSPENDEIIKQCAKLEQTALACVKQASIPLSKESRRSLATHIRSISAEIRAESCHVDAASYSPKAAYHTAERKKTHYAQTHPHAPAEVLAVSGLTDELTQMFAPDQPAPEEATVRNVLHRLSAAAHELATAARKQTRELAEALQNAAREAQQTAYHYGNQITEGFVRVKRSTMKHALDIWQNLRDGASFHAHRLWNFFYGTGADAPETILPSLSRPLPTLSAESRPILDGVIATLRHTAISEVITIGPNCKITASQVATIVTNGTSEYVTLPCHK